MGWGRGQSGSSWVGGLCEDRFWHDKAVCGLAPGKCGVSRTLATFLRTRSDSYAAHFAAGIGIAFGSRLIIDDLQADLTLLPSAWLPHPDDAKACVLAL